MAACSWSHLRHPGRIRALCNPPSPARSPAWPIRAGMARRCRSWRRFPSMRRGAARPPHPACRRGRLRAAGSGRVARRAQRGGSTRRQAGQHQGGGGGAEPCGARGPPERSPAGPSARERPRPRRLPTAHRGWARRPLAPAPPRAARAARARGAASPDTLRLAPRTGDGGHRHAVSRERSTARSGAAARPHPAERPARRAPGRARRGRTRRRRERTARRAAVGAGRTRSARVGMRPWSPRMEASGSAARAHRGECGQCRATPHSGTSRSASLQVTFVHKARPLRTASPFC